MLCCEALSFDVRGDPSNEVEDWLCLTAYTRPFFVPLHEQRRQEMEESDQSVERLGAFAALSS